MTLKDDNIRRVLAAVVSSLDTIIYIIFLFYFLHLISDNIEPPTVGWKLLCEALSNCGLSSVWCCVPLSHQQIRIFEFDCSNGKKKIREKIRMKKRFSM